MRRTLIVTCSLAATLLAGCDMLGIESPERVAAAREADGKAIGGACRHAGRAIEDCYALNKKADRSAVFAGWRDMNDYMRENKIDAVAPQLTGQIARASMRSEAAAEAEAPADKTAEKSAEKPAKKAADAKSVEGKATEPRATEPKGDKARPAAGKARES